MPVQHNLTHCPERYLKLGGRANFTFVTSEEGRHDFSRKEEDTEFVFQKKKAEKSSLKLYVEMSSAREEVKVEDNDDDDDEDPVL
jgi:hypothetical protein